MASPIDRLVADSRSCCISEEPQTLTVSVAPSLTYSSESGDEQDIEDSLPDTTTTITNTTTIRPRRASTHLVAQSAADMQLVKRCCGGGCRLQVAAAAAAATDTDTTKDGIEYEHIGGLDNDAYRSLHLPINKIPTKLTNMADVPEQTVYLQPLRRPSSASPSRTQYADRAAEQGTETVMDTSFQPPSFVQPHPPYHVHPVRISDVRELTKAGAEKRTFHFDLDITDYPEAEGVDFQVGGAIGICAPNQADTVDEILDLLYVPRFLRDKPVLLRTTQGRWPTVWGDDQARELVTTRRDVLTWCSDVQSYPPTKPLLRLLAEYATEPVERKILEFLCAGEGQGVFCDFRTGPHTSLAQLLHAFPSARPPLDHVLSVLPPLMPRFYSLSNDPHESWGMRDGKRHRLVEIAVTVHEAADWRQGTRTGIGSGFFQRQALTILAARARGDADPELYVPMFKGLMANPLAKQFVSDGPMLLIGAGVGIAPFRGFVQRRLKTATCANKVWVMQGIRDARLDELYSGEWGAHEDKVKHVVQSRRGEGRYVQEEVVQQADLVWYIINAVDGRVFVCGSTRGMGEGVEKALVEVAMVQGNLGREAAQTFWDRKREAGQYIAETW